MYEEDFKPVTQEKWWTEVRILGPQEAVLVQRGHTYPRLFQRARQGTSGGNCRKMIFFSTPKNFLILEPLKKKKWWEIAFSLSNKLPIIEDI